MNEADAPSARRHSWSSRIPVEWGIALLALLVFLPAVTAGFVYDDTDLIVRNPFVHSWEYLPRAFSTHFWDTYLGRDATGLVYYRPLTTVSFIADWTISGGSAAYFHAVNVVAHAVAVWLFTRTAIRWLGDKRIAAVVGLVFALHPTRTENVIWVAGRTDVLMTLFLFATLELLHVAAQRERRRVWWVLGAVAAGTCSLLSKEPAVLLPLLIGVDALRQERRSPQRSFYLRALVVTSVLGVMYLAARTTWLPVNAEGQFSFTPRFALYTIATYVERGLWPLPQTFFHRMLTNGADGAAEFSGIALALGAVSTLAIVALLVTAYKRDKVSMLSLLAACAFIAPVLNIDDTRLLYTTCDRYLYLPLALFALSLAKLFAGPVQRFLAVDSRRMAAASAAVVIVTFWSFINVTRAADYESDEVFWAYEAQLEETNPVPLENLSRHSAQQGRINEAQQLLTVALDVGRRYPKWNSPSTRLDTMVRQLELRAAVTADGDVGTLEAIERAYSAILRTEPPSPKTLAALGFEDFPSSKAALLSIANPTKRNAMRATVAFVAARLGHAESARAALDAIDDVALAYLPNPVNIVLSHARLGDFGAARARLSALERLDGPLRPDDAVLRGLERRITSAEALVAQARASRAPDSDLLRAKASAELGAYLLAIRRLTPHIRRENTPPNIAQFYAQLLMAARLEARAMQLITEFVGPEQAPAIIDGIRSQLPESLRDIPAVNDAQPLTSPR